jgi:hypothetical protein
MDTENGKRWAKPKVTKSEHIGLNLLNHPVTSIWPEFSGGKSSVTIQQLLGHAAGVQDAFPPNFGPQYLDDLTLMERHFEETSLPEAVPGKYVYLLQLFLVMAIAKRVHPELECEFESLPSFGLFNWLDDRLRPLGLDMVVPAGKGEEAVICRDLPQMSVPMTEIEGQEQSKDDEADDVHRPGSKYSMLEACKDHPFPFDPLKANVLKSTGSRDQLRAGFPLAASARGLATMLSSPELLEELEELGVLETASQDRSALGWFLTAGGCEWNKGGLQHLQLNPAGITSWCGKAVQGYGVISGLGPCVVTFPNASGHSITLAITVNNILQGRKAAAELAQEVFSHFGYKPAWTQIPLRVTMEAGRLLAENQMAKKMLKEWKHMLKEGSAGSRTSCLDPETALRLASCCHCACLSSKSV